jgi:hypothetical protein
MGIARQSWTRALAAVGVAVALVLPGRLGLHAAMAAAGGGLPSNQLSLSSIKGLHRMDPNFIPPSLRNGQGHARFGVTDVDSVPNFNTHFMLPGFDPFGNPNKTWYVNTVGNPPQLGGTTTFNAPVFPLTMELMNVDGHGTNVMCDANTATQQYLHSPVFQNAPYSSSSTPTQWADAILRAEYFKKAKPDWHTLLAADPEPNAVLQFPPGTYQYAPGPGGICLFAFVDINAFTNQVFPSTPSDTSTVIGAAEHNGEMTTQDVATFLMGNVILSSQGQPFALGFHTYDAEPGDANNGNRERRYLLNVSGWLDPSIFPAILADASTVTHEISELFNDPFVASDNVHDVSPWWTDPTGSICSDALETGDVIEFLPNQIYPITLNGFMYHNQTEALIQWFEGVTPSDAVGGAFSYPDTSVLTSPLVSMKANCAP